MPKLPPEVNASAQGGRPSGTFSLELSKILEPLCCKKWQKIPSQETGFGNRKRLKVLNDISLVHLNEQRVGKIWCDLWDVGAESAPPPGGNRVKVSENLDAMEDALVAPAVTSLMSII